LFAIRRDIIGFLTTIAREYGDIVYFKIGPIDVVLSIIRIILKMCWSRTIRTLSKVVLELAKRLLGEGLLTSEGEFHTRQWRMIQPAFHRKRIERMSDHDRLRRTIE
jgi:cytochrome P450